MTTCKEKTFRDIIGDYPEYRNAKIHRALAVSCALELIKADVATARERNTTTLQSHMTKLGEYADIIQQALDVSE